MKDVRRPVEEWWQLIGELVIPRKSYVGESDDAPDASRFRRLYDTTAVDACATAANGHVSYITPSGDRWFSWAAPDHVRSDEVDGWYRRCSLIAAKELAAGNFYTNIHETYEDRVAFGIGSISVWPGKRNSLMFRSHEISSYAIGENDEGYVDKWGCEYDWPISRIVQMFGEDAVEGKMAESWHKYKNEHGPDTKHKFIHIIRPNYKAEPGKIGTKNMPFESAYVALDGPYVLFETGLIEFPVCWSRYLKHNGSTGVYGFGPAWRALPTISQLNFNEKLLDLVAEKSAVPPVLIPDYLEGDVDMRAGGVTTFAANRAKGPHAIPQEWLTGGRYDVGVDRSDRKREDINKAFHVDLFRMFAELEKRSQMSVLEVSERTSEKLINFSPTFTRFTADFQVCMNRVFRILLRQGKFPPPPPGALVPDQFTGVLDVENPEVLYQSKVALALQSLQNTGIDRTMQRALDWATALGDPSSVAEEINLGRALHTAGRNEGVPEDIFNTPEEKQAILEQKQAQEQAMMAAELAKSLPNQGQAPGGMPIE